MPGIWGTLGQVPANIILSVIITTIIVIYYDGGIFQACRVVIVRIPCGYEYENASETAVQIAAALSLQVSPCSRREQSRKAARAQPLAPAEHSNRDRAM